MSEPWQQAGLPRMVQAPLARTTAGADNLMELGYGG